jgi:hypothetical protein
MDFPLLIIKAISVYTGNSRLAAGAGLVHMKNPGPEMKKPQSTGNWGFALVPAPRIERGTY